MPDTQVLREWFGKIDADIAFLTQCFAEVLEELGESELTYALPWCDRGDTNRPAEEPERESINRELQVLSIAYHLLNLVEENAAAQARRARESRFGLLHEPGLWGHGLNQLIEQGFGESEIAEGLDGIHVEVVLTAHPTEAKRPPVLWQHRELFEEFCQLENSMWTPHERRIIRNRIKVILERLWRTGEMYLEKPDVLTELDYVMDYMREIFPRAVSSVQQRLREAWREAGLSTENLPATERWPNLTFGNWVGGDRDGHPLVTADVTKETLQRLRLSALEILDNRLDTLSQRLTLSELFQDPPATLTGALAQMKATLSEERRETVSDLPGEPWREFVDIVRTRLRPAKTTSAVGYDGPGALERDLILLRRSLEAVGAERIAQAEVDPLLTHLETFGFHLAALDIRQNSAFYDKALSELLKTVGFEDWNFAKWDESKRLDFLQRELSSPRPLTPRYGAIGETAQAVVDCFQVVADAIRDHGKNSIGSFIISMTRDVTDLLVVYLFAREVGLLRDGDNGLYCEVPVVPLFETLDDLERSPDIMRQFLNHPIARRSLQRGPDGKPFQQVMLGYSDSSKDGGIFASHWALHRAQDELTKAGVESGVRIAFFHGRGGTFSRGAGPTHRFLEALPSGSLSGVIRMTEQGEVIAQKFGNPPTAEFNLELLLAGVTVTSLKHSRPHQEDPKLAELCDKLSEYSSEKYRSLLSRDGFLEFWTQATPIDALERSFIGSRPSRRTGATTLDDLRAIPWVFSWTQARYYLPSWYGVGSALERLQREHPEGFQLLQAHANDFPFVRYVLSNVETSLASADLGLMKDYASLVENPEVRREQFNEIADEYNRTERMIDTFFGKRRAERRPRLVKTLEMRAEGLRRLHARQIELLRQWRSLRAEDRHTEADAMIPSLLLSINAIASAERTTG